MRTGILLLSKTYFETLPNRTPLTEPLPLEPMIIISKFICVSFANFSIIVFTSPVLTSVENFTLFFSHFSLKVWNVFFTISSWCPEKTSPYLIESTEWGLTNKPTIDLLLSFTRLIAISNPFSEYFEPYICEANLIFKDQLEYNWNGYRLNLVYTPGHSKGSSCITIDNDFIFTGDSLFENLPIITRFKGGNENEYKNVTLPYLYTLGHNINVFPGHGEIFILSKDILDNLKFN